MELDYAHIALVIMWLGCAVAASFLLSGDGKGRLGLWLGLLLGPLGLVIAWAIHEGAKT